MIIIIHTIWPNCIFKKKSFKKSIEKCIGIVVAEIRRFLPRVKSKTPSYIRISPRRRSQGRKGRFSPHRHFIRSQEPIAFLPFLYFRLGIIDRPWKRNEPMNATEEKAGVENESEIAGIPLYAASLWDSSERRRFEMPFKRSHRRGLPSGIVPFDFS